MKNKSYSLTELIKQGGILYNIAGSGKNEILSNIIHALPQEIISSEKRNNLLNAVMEREELISTGIENGIAIPHSRVPLLEEDEPPFITIAFINEPVDWGTPDNKPVHTIFLIVSESPKQHLNALTKINFLCMDKAFYELITSQAGAAHPADEDKERIIAAVEEAEKGWRK